MHTIISSIPFPIQTISDVGFHGLDDVSSKRRNFSDAVMAWDEQRLTIATRAIAQSTIWSLAAGYLSNDNPFVLPVTEQTLVYIVAEGVSRAKSTLVIFLATIF